MPETRILLLRHAETADPSRFHGSESDIGLGERGHRQALAVAGVLAQEGATRLVSSGMRRALETARPIGEACGLEVQVEPLLHERSMGPLSGVSRDAGLATYDEARKRWKIGELDYTHEGGESYAQIQARVLPIFERIASANPDQTSIIVAHGVVIRVLLTTLLPGNAHADFDTYAIDNVGINDLRLTGSLWHADSLNQTPPGDRDPFPW